MTNKFYDAQATKAGGGEAPGQAMLNWIKLEKGCQMPDYDDFVLWRTEDGNYFVREIDKDDYDWWNGVNDEDGHSLHPLCTHWAKIPFSDSPQPSPIGEKPKKEK